MELSMRQMLNEIQSDLQAFIGIESDGGDWYLRVHDMKHKKNIQRYLELFCNRDEDIEECDTRKLKITTYLLHMNDIPHVGEDFSEKVWQYDLGVHFDSKQGEETTFYFAKTVDEEMKDIVIRECENCGRIVSDRELLKCGACKLAYFCNEQCQRAFWPYHRILCKYENRTKLNLLQAKQQKAWKFFLCSHGKEILEFFDHVETQCGKKSKVLLLTNVVHSGDTNDFQFRTVSMRFFTSYQQNAKEFIAWNKMLKTRSKAYLLAIPYNGYFNFLPMLA